VKGAHRTTTFVFGVVVVVLGLAILVRTASLGGGTFGFVVGALFVGLGGGRLYLLLRRSGPDTLATTVPLM
jgi:hypothetical protein